ncbi:MAG: FecR family protein [Candidatus Sumerlaeaceae bacterium]
MRGKTNPQNVSAAGLLPEDELRAMYGEPVHRTDDASPSFDADAKQMKSLLHDWVNADLPTATRERFRGALLGSVLPTASTSEGKAAMTLQVRLVPTEGSVSIRRSAASTAVPCSSPVLLGRSTQLEVPGGSRAQLYFADGTLFLLAGNTTMEILPADTSRTNDTSDAAMLKQGRIFASVARQSSGRLSLATSRGRISVVGTEFDVESRADDSLQIIVAEGEVRYRAYSLSGEPAAVDVSLRAGDLLQVPRRGSPATIAPRKLTARELRHHVAWSRIATTGHHARRGSIAWKAVITLTMIAGLIIAYTQWSKDRVLPIGLVHPGQSVAAASARPLDSTPGAGSSASHPGQEVIANAEIQTKTGNNWVTSEKVKASRRVVDQRPDGTQVVECAVIKQESFRDDPMAKAMAAFANKPVRYTMGLEGELSDIRFPALGGKFDPRSAIMFMEMIRHTWMMAIPTTATLPTIPVGQTWERRDSGNIPLVPGGKYAFNSTVRYDGPSTNPQVSENVGRFSYKGTGVLNGIPLSEENRGDRGTKLFLSEFKSEETGSYEIDMQSHTMSGELREHRTVTAGQTSTAPNKQPFTRTLPPTIIDRRIKLSTQASR